VPDRLVQAAASSWIGREDLLARLQEAAGDVAAGATALGFVTGDGGIGKTRLVAELASRLPGFDVLYGRCDEEQHFPYGPWVQALRPRLARLADPELAGLLGGAAADLARLLPEIRERLPEVASASRHGDPDTERHQLFVAIAQLLGRLAARRPLLVVVDDLHWADRSSLLLWRHVADDPGLGAVLLVGTFRDTELHPGHPLPELIADLERHRDVPRIALGGMDEGEVGALIGSVHDAEVDAGTVRAIRTETDGNPFFVKQLVRHLEEVGGDGGLDAFDGLAVPQGVRDVIARRVSRLSADAGPVLRVAALLGRDFEFEVLAEVVELDEEPLLDVLDEAVRGGLLVELPSTPGRYSFAHALLRTTLEAELSRTRRARLHARIGAAIERQHAGRLEPWLDELARHFAEAGPQESARAVHYAMRAAEQATRRVAYDESVRLLRRAAEVRRGEAAADPAGLAGLAELERALAGAEGRAGRWKSARASFARSAEAARAAGDAEAFALAALGHSGGTWDHWGRLDRASAALLEEALERLGPGDGALRVQVLARLATIRYYDDGPEERVLRPAADAVAMARRLGDREALTAALVAEHFARWVPGSAPERLGLSDELVALTESAGRPLEVAEAHMWRASALLELCRLEEADAHLARHEELVEVLAQVPSLVHRDALRATRAVLEGDYEAGAAAARALLTRGSREQAQDPASTAITLSFHAAVMMSLLTERGEFGRMVPELDQLVHEQPRLPGWRVMRAWAHLQAGDRDRARTTLEELAGPGLPAFPRDVNFVPSLALLAHIAADLRDGTIAARVEPLLAPFCRFWVVFGIGGATLGPVAYSVGLLRLVQGRADDAIPSFELALERSHAMRARPYVARSQAGLAAALRVRGASGDAGRAAELEAKARDAARELGMLRLERELAGTQYAG
jgi:tetratricopeptide (TPR) repeat protein